MTAPSPLMVALDRRLKAWRRRELNDDGVLWHGINRIRQGLCDDKAEARTALLALVETGRAERFDCSSGVFWRALPPPMVDVRGTAK